MISPYDIALLGSVKHKIVSAFSSAEEGILISKSADGLWKL